MNNNRQNFLERNSDKLFFGIIGLILGMSIAFLIAFQINPSVTKLFDKSFDKVVEIRCSNDNETWGFATGCFIDADGTILTNKHVVKNNNSESTYEYIEVRTAADNDWHKARIFKLSDQSDLALLKTDFKRVNFFKLAKSARNGEKIYTIGNPNGYGLSFLEGVVSGNLREVRILGESYTMMQTSFIINGGNSGGPVFNTDGKLIGLMSFRTRDNMNEVLQGVSFAVPISDIKEFISSK